MWCGLPYGGAMTEYEKLTEKALNLSPTERAEQIAYWYTCHSDETDHTSLLTEDLMCQCCGVDYSGLDRDLLDTEASTR